LRGFQIAINRDMGGESQCGGYFAPQMKYAGYDALIINGRSTKPVYIAIKDDEVRVEDAGHLWGKDTFETERIIIEDHRKEFQILCIGPAGENLVRCARA
jgi:aldehyde:ferredoxin oxidoreductase